MTSRDARRISAKLLYIGIALALLTAGVFMAGKQAEGRGFWAVFFGLGATCMLYYSLVFRRLCTAIDDGSAKGSLTSLGFGPLRIILWMYAVICIISGVVCITGSHIALLALAAVFFAAGVYLIMFAREFGRKILEGRGIVNSCKRQKEVRYSEPEITHVTDNEEQIVVIENSYGEEARIDRSIEMKLAELNAIEKKFHASERKLDRLKELIKIYEIACHSVDVRTATPVYLADDIRKEADELAPSRLASLHCLDFSDLKKLYSDHKKTIEERKAKYKSIAAEKPLDYMVYCLLTSAMESELQLILTTVSRYPKEQSVLDVKKMCGKYLHVVSDAMPKAEYLSRYIVEMESLMVDEVNIEYEYVIRKEWAKAEQERLKQQAQEEREERERLMEEERRLKAEAEKYAAEIKKLEEQKAAAKAEEQAEIEKRMNELQEQVDQLEDKREEIVKREKGLAGTVYIISNMGSFGENVFKIGMTRRLNPYDRIAELASASVPFSFDIHSTIFSENAVKLEAELHQRLNERRVNKVNLRKEFFRVTIDELEEIVRSIDPTAEFARAMIAEEFMQSKYLEEQARERLIHASGE